MIRYGMDVCQDHLVEFDSLKHQLLDKVWKVLEKHYDSSDRRKIYDEHHGRRIQMHGISKRNVPDSGKMPVEFKKGLPDDDMDSTTQLEDFLEGIYYIEDFFGIDSGQQLATLKEAENAVNRMPDDIAGIQNLKEILLENVIFLREHSQAFRSVVVYFDEDATHEHGKITNTKSVNEEHLQPASLVVKPHTFTEIESFSKEFHKHAIPVLKMGKIPNFEIKCSWYEYLVGQIQRVAYSINLYFRTTSPYAIDIPFREKNIIGYLLADVYRLGSCFEKNHSELFEPMIEQEVKRKVGKKDQIAKNVNQAKLWAFYQEHISKNKDLTDGQIAQKFLFKYPNVYKNIPSIVALLSRLKDRALLKKQ